MPKPLLGVERELVLKVKEFCDREKRNKKLLIPIECVRRRVAALIGISERKVSKIIQECTMPNTEKANKISPPDFEADLFNKIVMKVNKFCELEKHNKTPLVPLECTRRRVAVMIGISERTVTKISQEGELAASMSTKICTPGKIRNRKKNITPLECSILRHKIDEYYAMYNELPTVCRMLDEMRNDIDYKGSRTTLWRVIKEKGFFKKYSGDISTDEDNLYIIEVGEDEDRMSDNDAVDNSYIIQVGEDGAKMSDNDDADNSYIIQVGEDGAKMSDNDDADNSYIIQVGEDGARMSGSDDIGNSYIFQVDEDGEQMSDNHDADDSYIIEVGERMSGNDDTDNCDTEDGIIIRESPLNALDYLKKYSNVIKQLNPVSSRISNR